MATCIAQTYTSGHLLSHEIQDKQNIELQKRKEHTAMSKMTRELVGASLTATEAVAMSSVIASGAAVYSVVQGLKEAKNMVMDALKDGTSIKNESSIVNQVQDISE